MKLYYKLFLTSRHFSLELLQIGENVLLFLSLKINSAVISSGEDRENVTRGRYL